MVKKKNFKIGDIVVRDKIPEYIYEVIHVTEDGLVYFKNLTSDHMFFKNIDIASKMYNILPKGKMEALKILYGTK